MTVTQYLAALPGQAGAPPQSIVGIAVQGQTLYLVTQNYVFTIDTNGNIKPMQVTPA